jgi:hypothetical protein
MRLFFAEGFGAVAAGLPTVTPRSERVAAAHPAAGAQVPPDIDEDPLVALRARLRGLAG